MTDPLTGQRITQIVWAGEDALPFPLCLSAQTDSAHGGQFIELVSVARGNIVLADHGFTVAGESLGAVPLAPLAKLAASSCERCEPPRSGGATGAFSTSSLKARPLTFATRDPAARRSSDLRLQHTDADDLDDQILPADLQKQFEARGRQLFQRRRPCKATGRCGRSATGSAHSTLSSKSKANSISTACPLPAARVRRARNRATHCRRRALHSELNQDDTHWTAVRDLLDSSAADAHFVAEIEDDGTRAFALWRRSTWACDRRR